MANFKALSRGSQLVLVAGPLLFLSLFFTWQYVEVDYGRAGVATMSLDGWDAWGLLLALLVIATVVARRARKLHGGGALGRRSLAEDHARARDRASSPSPSLKSLTDAGSSWLSYGFVGLAVAVSVGTYLDWAATRKSDGPVLQRKRRGISSVV